jgi:formylglycine-generating enzyme required for sulfatase activity
MAACIIEPPPPRDTGNQQGSSGSDNGGQQTAQTQTPAQPTEQERMQQKLDAQEQARQQRTQPQTPPQQTTAQAQQEIAKIKQNMVTISGGSFTIGNSNPPGLLAETPHKVTLTGFRISKYEVTQAQWTAVMGSNPSFFN